MNTILKNILLSLLAAAVFSLVSCENMLDNEQHGAYTPEGFYKTDEEAEQALAAVYAYYSNSGNLYNIYFLKNLLSDDFWCGGGGRGDNAPNEQLNEYTFNADHPYLSGAFQSFYGVIYRANLILENVSGATPVQLRTIAEAKVFRALAYIDLISMWGTPPLVDHILAPDEYQQPNGDPAALWVLVENDLTEAISSNALHEKAGANDNSSYRITKQFAQALLGKVYIFQEKFADAIPVLDQVVASGKYELLSGNLYENILQYTHENNSESLFECNYLSDPQNTTMSLFALMTGWRTDYMTLPAGSGIFNGTWGFCNPQKELYDAFVSTEGVNGLRLTQTMINYEQFTAKGFAINSSNSLYSCEGYLMWKSRKANDEFVEGVFGGSHNNIRIMRYPEVLLLAAEAHIKGGGAQAATYVNQVRARAGLPPKGNVSMEDVMLEKRLELCGESVRFQDMLRWRIADKMSAQGTQTPTLLPNGTVTYAQLNSASVAGFKERHWLLPFPQAELTNNPNITQNPGW
ncbi:MAG: RagB/SusD family nutrient uptake outer membrane protein [Bacteroidales bacterium]|jgi:hypothetical protein|nr:RagB/SusD family nutrient uptake outer membrane protein [Bacteroidales bacterium]